MGPKNDLIPKNFFHFDMLNLAMYKYFNKINYLKWEKRFLQAAYFAH